MGSGTGSNASALCQAATSGERTYTVELVLSTAPDAGICEVARVENVALEVVPAALKGEEFSNELCTLLEKYQIDVLVLAGFMRLLSPLVLACVRGHVVNIHPALLPEFGGKGMYGIHVHEAVISAGRTETGATVHVVTEKYDEGAVIMQTRVPVLDDDSATSLQQRVKEAEHRLYPEALDLYIRAHWPDHVGSASIADGPQVS